MRSPAPWASVSRVKPRASAGAPHGDGRPHRSGVSILLPWNRGAAGGAVCAHPRGPVSREGWLGTVLCGQHQAWGAGIPRRPVKGPRLRLCPRWGGKQLQQPAWGPVKPWAGRSPGTASPTRRSRPWGTEALDSTGRQAAAQTRGPVWLQCSFLRLWVPTCVWNP